MPERLSWERQFYIFRRDFLYDLGIGKNFLEEMGKVPTFKKKLKNYTTLKLVTAIHEDTIKKIKRQALI